LSSLSNRDRVQSVINAAARLTTGTRKYDHVTPLLKDPHWLRVPQRISYNLCVLVFIQLSSRYGATLLTRCHPACRCNLAPSSPVDILVRTGSYGNATNYDRKQSFCRRITSCMEQFPQLVTDCTSSGAFRQYLHYYFRTMNSSLQTL